MLSFLECNNALSDFQLKFRPNYSTSTACSCLITKLTKYFSANTLAVTAFLDLNKAFSLSITFYFLTINKLYHCGFRVVSQSWLESYLFRRSQQVSIQEFSQGGGEPPHWPEKHAKSHVFGAFENKFCSKNENSPPQGIWEPKL